MTNHWINQNLPAHITLSDREIFAVCLAAALLGGAALHYSIKRPCLTLRDRLLNGKP